MITRRAVLRTLVVAPVVGPLALRLVSSPAVRGVPAVETWARLSQRWHPLQFATTMERLKHAVYHRHTDATFQATGFRGWFANASGEAVAFTRVTAPLRNDPGVIVSHMPGTRLTSWGVAVRDVPATTTNLLLEPWKRWESVMERAREYVVVPVK